MAHEHIYKTTAVWTGNKGEGTKNVRNYDRSHTVTVEGKPELFLTTDNPAVGDKSKLNPEDLLVSAISSCHMLSYLYVCALEGIVITAYTDNAMGIMIETTNGGGSFKEVTLNPIFYVADESMVEKGNSITSQSPRILLYSKLCEF
jgi:organic hydroperoxide reductase OsmC/OhrA